MTNKPVTLDDVLETIMVEEEEPSFAAMNRWIARYPQYRADLVSFFTTWAIQAVEPSDTPPIDSDALASRGVSYALSLLHEQDQSRSQTLLERARSSHVSESQLAAKTNLDDSLLQKLDRRLLKRIPRECVRRLAVALNESLEYIAQLITGPPQFGYSRHKAEKKPVREQEDFLVALKHSSLSDEAKREWVKILSAEESSSS